MIVITEEDDNSDGDFDPTGRTSKRKARVKQSNILSGVEQARIDTHTLRETHDFMYPGSFDHGTDFLGGIVSSSSQFGGFGFNDDLVDISAEIGDELARELGEGWGASPVRSAKGCVSQCRLFLVVRCSDNIQYQ